MVLPFILAVCPVRGVLPDSARALPVVAVAGDAARAPEAGFRHLGLRRAAARAVRVRGVRRAGWCSPSVNQTSVTGCAATSKRWRGAWVQERVTWMLLVGCYLLFIAAVAGLTFVARRRTVVVYNVEPAAFESLLTEVFDQLGRPVERRGKLWVGGAPLCEVDTFEGGRTAVLRWVSDDTRPVRGGGPAVAGRTGDALRGRQPGEPVANRCDRRHRDHRRVLLRPASLRPVPDALEISGVLPFRCADTSGIDRRFRSPRKGYAHEADSYVSGRAGPGGRGSAADWAGRVCRRAARRPPALGRRTRSSRRASRTTACPRTRTGCTRG